MGEPKAEAKEETIPSNKEKPKPTRKTAITDEQIDAIKKVTDWDDEEIYLRAVTKFGYDVKDIHDVSEGDAGQWILKLQKENK